MPASCTLVVAKSAPPPPAAGAGAAVGAVWSFAEAGDWVTPTVSAGLLSGEGAPARARTGTPTPPPARAALAWAESTIARHESKAPSRGRRAACAEGTATASASAGRATSAVRERDRGDMAMPTLRPAPASVTRWGSAAVGARGLRAPRGGLQPLGLIGGRQRVLALLQRLGLLL